ncbi:L-ribulose-5-phosphate 4-epimerase AraD [Clostridium sp. MCC353]|uniref:L-ribulose-5-phosphate 4-epimerase AraD n=1 Tax=Clostridium sp. MCC353 TaxID=2592646 RepID=UPI001C012EC0|nr:L-ribulose-5-phosphate 4-epimerase AraD [Clostridium sp. MCC353]MBT9778930.1 L-ribulose-5-phosphate 4-epimerase AraD [Clostridium sp. MCC353]
MDLKQLKQEVYDANLELVKRGLVIYTWGNVSAVDREKGLVAIKPKGIEYDRLTADDMSVVTLDGTLLDGLLPSVDLDIHLEIYKNFPEVGGIAHTHSTWATAWCQAGKGIPVLGTTHADHFYGEIPCTRQMTRKEVETDYERNVGKVICGLFKGRNMLEMGAVLTPGHGPFTWGKDGKAAVEHSVILEELAKMAKLSLDIMNADINGKTANFLPDYMLKKHYTRKYGADSYFYQDKT